MTVALLIALACGIGAGLIILFAWWRDRLDAEASLQGESDQFYFDWTPEQADALRDALAVVEMRVQETVQAIGDALLPVIDRVSEAFTYLIEELSDDGHGKRPGESDLEWWRRQLDREKVSQ